MNFITKQVEKKLGVDLNGDGVIGSGYGRHGYGGGYRHGGGGGGGGMINQLERATHMDLNGDGRIGGAGYGYAPPPCYGPPGYPPYQGAPCPPNYYGAPGYAPNYPPGPPPHYHQYGGQGYAPPPAHHGSGGGLINTLEKVTGMDINGDGRIGGRYPNYNPYGRHY